MLKYNFKYELILLFRSRWIQILSLILLMFFGFSSFNGKHKVDKKLEIISAAEIEIEKTDQMMIMLIDSIENGYDVNVPSWTIPTNPITVGNYHPRVIAVKPLPFSFIATGQSDLYTPFVKPTLSGDDYAINFLEMTSPIQLLFGSFDLAFVIVYLMPLLIIAFSYNVLSAEKEGGSIYLLASQPINMNIWLFQKLGLRLFWLAILVIISITLVFLILKIDLFSYLTTYFSFLIQVLVYLFFWFVLAFLVNLFVGNSAKNAVSLISLWIIFVLLVPSILNQLGNTFYPMPSRTLMINEMRSKKTEVTEKQDKILDNFLRDHPEYALNNASEQKTFYHRYIASQELIMEEMAPIVKTYEEQLKNQQYLIKRLKWISPSLMIQTSLNKLAGNSSDDYENFRKQAITYAETWRNYLTPFLFNNKNFTANDFIDLPKFKNNQLKSSSHITLMQLLFISLSLLSIPFFFSKRAVI